MDTQDFPDLDSSASASGAAQQSNKSKADSAMIYSFGASTKGARAAGDEPEENKSTTQATKPVFKGKAKFLAGGATNEEVANSRMNYDFSKMRMSAATSKKTEGGADGEQRNRDGDERRGAGPRTMGFDDEDEDFEVVREKKKTTQRRGGDFAEPTFGGGKPSFMRGGGARRD